MIDASACYTSFEKLHLGTQFGTVVDSGVMPLDWIESSTEADLLCGVVTSRSNLPPSLPKLVTRYVCITIGRSPCCGFHVFVNIGFVMQAVATPLAGT